MTGETVERFRPTSGRVTGTGALLLVAAVVVVGVADREDGLPAWVVLGALLLGVLVWASMLRPAVRVTTEDLVLRNMLDTVTVPLGAIEAVAVRQVLAVRAGDRRFVSPAIGRSWRQAVRTGSGPSSQPAATPTATATSAMSYPDYVEDRIRRLASDDRTRRGIRAMSEEQLALAREVRRRPAWPEIAMLVVTAVGLVVTLLV